MSSMSFVYIPGAYVRRQPEHAEDFLAIATKILKEPFQIRNRSEDKGNNNACELHGIGKETGGRRCGVKVMKVGILSNFGAVREAPWRVGQTIVSPGVLL